MCKNPCNRCQYIIHCLREPDFPCKVDMMYYWDPESISEEKVNEVIDYMKKWYDFRIEFPLSCVSNSGPTNKGEIYWMMRANSLGSDSIIHNVEYKKSLYLTIPKSGDLTKIRSNWFGTIDVTEETTWKKINRAQKEYYMG